jgi:hypothetical protein
MKKDGSGFAGPVMVEIPLGSRISMGMQRLKDVRSDAFCFPREVPSLRHPDIRGNGMSPPWSGVLARDRAKHLTFAFRSALALRSPKGEVGCRLTQAAYRQAHEKNGRAVVSNAGLIPFPRRCSSFLEYRGAGQDV